MKRVGRQLQVLWQLQRHSGRRSGQLEDAKWACLSAQEMLVAWHWTLTLKLGQPCPMVAPIVDLILQRRVSELI
jgi:hypothetical protein